MSYFFSNRLEILNVYQYDLKKKFRLGVIGDGGYVLCELDGGYDCYISAGVSNEESFSRDFINKYDMNETNSFAFDATINDFPYDYTKKITFIKKNIGDINNHDTSNLIELCNKYNNIFLKMDVEGAEYPWLKCLSETNLNSIKQLVVEFHCLNNNSCGTTMVDKFKCLQKLNNTHYLVHAHGNNCGSILNGIPETLELTFVNKNMFDNKPELNTTPLPVPNLDYPNGGSPDYNLNLKPFVNI
jgi:hypothetical protein